MISLLLLLLTIVADQRQATPSSSIRMADNFEVELLRSAQEGESSWISMTFDPAGNLILGLDDRGVGKLELSNTSTSIPFSRLSGTEDMRHVRGILYAHDSLYVVATDSQEIYRLKDLNGDGQYEDRQVIQKLAYNSRYGHGMNQVVLGPDQMVYFIIGNDVVMPSTISDESTYRRAQNDWLLPYSNDLGQDNRVGYIAKTDPEGKTWTILAGGFRNPFDMAFNPDGELFTWDADMEWDVGLPWYRPTRLNHVVLGGDYGWRWGTGKRPGWFPDSLPSTLDTGYSSPTALTFCDKSNWPKEFHDLLLMADWQLGRIFLVRLTPRGATYEAEWELFAEGAPFNVCDMAFGPDGHLYCITGGRGSQSGLYRIRYSTTTSKRDGHEQLKSTLPYKPSERKDLSGIQERRTLEKLQQQPDPEKLDFIWERLGNDDEWLASAARGALERLPTEQWRSRIENSTNRLATLNGLIALAHVGSTTEQIILIDALRGLDWSKLAKREKLLALRALQLSLVRHPSIINPASLVMRDGMGKEFPSNDFAVNWLEQELLVLLNAPNIIDRSLLAIENATTQEEQFQYAKTLLSATSPWNDDQLSRILNWLERSRVYQGGKLLDTIRQQFIEKYVAKLNEAEQGKFADKLERLKQPLDASAQALDSPKAFVKKWELSDLEPELAKIAGQPVDTNKGREALRSASCLKCHRFDGVGTHVGPDLTGVGRRYDARALLESILEPSKQIDPKYLNTTYLMKDGSVVSGRTVGVSKAQLVLEVDPLNARTQTIDRAEIEASSPAKLSPMPAGLVDVLSQDEVLALVRVLRGE